MLHGQSTLSEVTIILDHISWQFQPCPSNVVIADKIHLLIRVFWPSSVSTVASSSSVKSKVLICFQYTIKQTFYYHSIPNTCSTKLFNIGPFHTGEKVVYYEKFSVITNILLVWMVCAELTNFGQSGQTYISTIDKIWFIINWEAEHQ